MTAVTDDGTCWSCGKKAIRVSDDWICPSCHYKRPHDASKRSKPRFSEGYWQRGGSKGPDRS